ncbi:MAG: Stp1/IreP family PP2C-type Ser/Thr phosphatase [Cellulosilyticaceae bacterium]
MIAVGKTDIGKKRTKNEDYVFVSNKPIGVLQNLYIVADGMGGHKGGQVASQLAIDAFCAYIEQHKRVKITTEEELFTLLKRGIIHANHVIFTKSQDNMEWKGMGTTMTLCTVYKKTAYIAHVGDSRMYVINSETIQQITKDHSLVQEMHDKGIISKNDMKKHPHRHVITRAVGTYEPLKVDTLKKSLEDVDYILLCSDGLTSMVQDEIIHKIVYKEKEPIDKVIEELFQCANDEGGVDNIAIIIAKQKEVSQKC